MATVSRSESHKYEGPQMSASGKGKTNHHNGNPNLRRITVEAEGTK